MLTLLSHASKGTFLPVFEGVILFEDLKNTKCNHRHVVCNFPDTGKLEKLVINFFHCFLLVVSYWLAGATLHGLACTAEHV